METSAEDLPEFPSLMMEDTTKASPYRAAQFHLRQALQALSDLAPGRDSEKRKAQDDAMIWLRQVLQFLHVHFSPEREATGAASFGELLRQHRSAAGLTQRQLANYANLSISLIRKLEQGDTLPTRSSLLALCSVAELRLVPPEVTSVQSAREQHRLSPNWIMSPGFDSVSMIDELDQVMNGSGGALEQTFVYMDHKSALDWIAVCNSPGYTAICRDGFPVQEAAKTIREVLGPVGLDVIALGPGDGKSEVRLVQRLVSGYEEPNIRFYLLDISQPLLSRAFKHAVDTVGDESGVFVCGIQGSFHHLPRYAQLHYTPARSHRRRLYTMLGNTVANLDHEPQFFQTAFTGAAPGDLLLFDVDYCFTTVADAAEIRRCDPALAKPLPDLLQRWLGGPIHRYCHDAQSVTFSYRVDTNRPLAGSYGLQIMATVGLPGMRTKEFCMAQHRRYEPRGLIQCLRTLGWESLGLFDFTGSTTRPRGLFLFRRLTVTSES